MIILYFCDGSEKAAQLERIKNKLADQLSRLKSDEEERLARAIDEAENKFQREEEAKKQRNTKLLKEMDEFRKVATSCAVVPLSLRARDRLLSTRSSRSRSRVGVCEYETRHRIQEKQALSAVKSELLETLMLTLCVRSVCRRRRRSSRNSRRRSARRTRQCCARGSRPTASTT